ncbi:uncharacterized protein PRCAT00002954001 [Priceomyces carsonii]|uniref:uncharacterized protein n=1 Tax=Priceomyces carsonii TaxID=28549 RepID=UPI002EDA8F9D|nr:unnamed protein product [Priceomyces carsonii]
MLKIPRLTQASTFNFFFANTKKSFLSDQNFIGNQFLWGINRSYIASPAKKDHGTSYESNLKSSHERNNTSSKSVLEDVASKVLNCQEPEAKLSQKLHSTNQNLHIPFKVNHKDPRPKSRNNAQENLKDIVRPYIKLTKPNLTILVTLSSICSYAISPYAVSLPELMLLTLGTALSSGAANAINMGREPEFDRRMPRTTGRPVVRGLVAPHQAYAFAALTGTLGIAMLYIGVNPTVAFLGLLNIVLYSWIYTSLKRISIINTWIGAIVGAIPPLMGWVASSPLSLPGAWCLAGLLYAWQFPHFNSLSHNIADQYKNAGYVMTAAENPKLNARVALRYSILMFPLCFGLSYFGVTDWIFPFDSAIANGWLTYLAFTFWNQQRKNYYNGSKPTKEGILAASVSAKKLFWCSVWQLPAVLILAMLHKRGQWDRILSYIDNSE